MILVNELLKYDEFSQETDVVLSDGEFTLVCFAHPCNLVKGQVFNDDVYVLNAEGIYKSATERSIINKLESHYSYHLSGKVIDIAKQIVQVGEFKICLGGEGIPKDIKEGDFIEFDAYRLDLY